MWKPLRYVVLYSALVGGGLIGCSFLKPRADTARYFVLSTAEPERSALARWSPTSAGDGRGEAPAPEPSNRSLGISRVSLPEYLQRVEMVTRTGSNELAVSSFELWAEPLRDGFSRVLSARLSTLLGADSVVTAPWDASHAPDLTLEVDVRRFERLGSGTAVLDARWTLRGTGSGVTLASRESVWKEPVSAAGSEAGVSALSRTVACLAREIAEAVRAQPREAPKAPGR